MTKIVDSDAEAAGLPRVSLITVCFNSVGTIRHTVQSVAAQDYPAIEYIVIDGASTDGTVAVLEEHRDAIDRLVSEPDGGIYHAMNKGIALASGEVIGFINSDDFYPRSDSISRIMKAFVAPTIEACYGDLCYVSPVDTSSVVRYWKSSPFRRRSFLRGWCPPHPTFLVRRNVYERHGSFDPQYGVAADIELMMRFLEVHEITAEYIPEVLVHMRIGGATNRSLKNILRQNKEILRAMKRHGLRPSLARFAGGKVISRGRQFVRRPATPSP